LTASAVEPGFLFFMDYLILALATWRIANLLTYEDGPFAAFERLRYRLGVRHDDYGRHAKNELARGLLCLWCNSVWVGVALTVAYWLTPASRWLALPLALSAAAILIDGAIGKMDDGKS